jgi:hypothetical protein
MCGATTVSAGLNTNVFVNGVLAAVVGDLDSHNLLGALISQSPGTIKINGIPMIASIMDQGSPDVIGLVTHVTGLPTPGTGSPNVNMYTGNFAGGLGNFGLSGIPGVGELMSFAGNIVGQVSRNAVQGGQSGMLAMSNMNPSVTQPTANSTIVSANTGKTFTFTSYYNNNGVVTGPVGLQVIPGNTSFTSAGTYSFTVPNYNTMTVTAKGAGGGGGSGRLYVWTYATGIVVIYGGGGASAGGNTTFGSSINAYGGLGGFYYTTGGPGRPGSPTGAGSPMFTELNDAYFNKGGEGGSTITIGGGSSGGAAGIGGRAGYYAYQIQNWNASDYTGRYGGTGGLVSNVWNNGGAGAPTPGQTVTIVVGAGGAASATGVYDLGTSSGPGVSGNYPGTSGVGSAGSSGSVSISWT